MTDKKSARMLCDIYRGAGRGRLETDPRGICQKAEEYLKTQGFDESFWGPEAVSYTHLTLPTILLV